MVKVSEGHRALECPRCHATKHWQEKCPVCAFTVSSINGFEAWAPRLAQSGHSDFFNADQFEDLARAEDFNFWFLARNDLILWALKHYFDVPRSFAEIGCGTGFVLRAIEDNYPMTEIIGTELLIEGLQFAAQRCKRSKLVQLDARTIPYRNFFDIVGVFDVLEHIEEDETVLAQIEKALVPGGGLLITVPQHRWLWSPVDEAACHVRRYSAEELERKVGAAGFKIIRSTSFVSFLLPAIAAARIKSRNSVAISGAELFLNRHLNWFLGRVMEAEFALIKRGVNFSLGGSRLLVARKTSE